MKKFYTLLSLLFGLTAFNTLNAQTNIAPLATASASTCNTGACSTLNDLNYGTCGSQQMWISTGTPPSLTPGVEWMQFDWAQPMYFNAITIHHAQTGTRFMAGATVQYYDFNASAWVTFFTFSGLPDQCINNVAFPSTLNAQRFRLTSFTMSGSQLSNINFREIEIWDAPAPNIPKDPPSPNFQYSLGVDTLWEGALSGLINTSTGAEKSYWNVTQYSTSSKGPWTNYSTLPNDPLQCNTLGCFLDTVRNNPNFYYTFPTRGFYKVSLTTVNVNGTATIEKIVQVDTPRSKPTAQFFATRRQIGANDRIQMNNLSTNAPARIKWWTENVCTNCAPDSNKFLPNDSTFNPVFAAYTPGLYKVCVAVSNSKGSDTMCRSDYMRVLPGYLMMHSETGRFDTVGTEDEGYLFSDLRNNTGQNLSGQFQPTTSAAGFRIAPCADTIYLTLERLRMRPGSFSGAGDSIYVRLNGFNGPIVRRFGGANITALKDTTKIYKFAGQALYITYTPAVMTTQPALVNDSGFTIRWRSSPAMYNKPVAFFTCPDTLYSGYKVRFINGSTGNRMAFAWDLNNDGIYGLEKPSVAQDSITLNPAITYFTNTPSTKKICLKTINCRGNDVYCRTLPIYPITLPPAPEFTVDKVIGFISDTFRFTDKTMNGATSWKWRFDPNNVTWLNGTDSNSQFPLVSLNSPQSYNVTLIATNPLGTASTTKNQMVSAIDYGSPNSAFPPVLDATDFGISRVVIKGANKILDTITDLKSPTYTSLFNKLNAVFYRGGVYQIDVYRNTANDAQSTRVWADFNRDADYTDEGEMVLAENLTKKVKTSLEFNIPGNAVVGNSRILIGVCNNISTISPISANVGVYEDFGMIIGNDLIKPTIILNGKSSEVTELGKSFTDPGVIATDNIEGDISSKVTVISNLNINSLGNYTIRYFVADLYGNVSDTLTRIVQVVLNANGPQLVLSGKDTFDLEVFSSFVEPGYTAKDNLGNPLNELVQRAGTLNTNVLGNYPLIYTIQDAFGLSDTKTRLVRVLDRTAPEIKTYIDNDTIIHQIGTVFDDAKYVYVTDNYWTDLNAVRTGAINANKAGFYLLSYTATDGSSNKANTMMVWVQVTNLLPPRMTLVGPSTMTIPVFSTFNDPGVLAKDFNGDILPFSSDLNEVLRTDTIWTATITYKADDGFNTVSIQRTVFVKDMESPVIELLGTNPVIQPLCKPYQDPGVKVTDNFDASVLTKVSKLDNMGLQVTIDSSKVNTCGGGFYYNVFITATDASGNKSEEKKRIVYVSATGIDEISMNGVSVFPNPAIDQINIQLESGKIATVSAIDMNGKLFNIKTLDSKFGYSADISELTAGLYLLQITKVDGSVASVKVIIQQKSN